MLNFHPKQSNVPNTELDSNVGETEPFQQQGDWPGTICLLYIHYVTPGLLKNDHTSVRDLAATTLAVLPHFLIVSLDHIFSS